MELRDILDENIIRIGIDAKDKDDALHKMAGLLYENQYIDDIEGFVKDVYARRRKERPASDRAWPFPTGRAKTPRSWA